MLLVVSLDSESLIWLDEQMGCGRLPNLAQLARTGSRLPFEAAALPGTAYPTLYTGLRPSDIGLYFPVQWSAEKQRMVPWTELPHPSGSLFEQVDSTGRRIVVLDPPECNPVRLQGSFCASGIQFRARVLLHQWSSDDSRGDALGRLLGPAPRADEVFGRPDTSSLSRLREALIGSPARMAKAALQFLRHEPPDCLWVNCCGMHIAGHQFFNLALLRDDSQRRTLENTRLEVAQRYDTMLGEILSALPAGADVLVFYAKGMRAAYGWQDLLPAMLRRILNEPEARAPVASLRTMVPEPLRRWVADRMPDAKALNVMARLSTPQADWSRTRAFTLASDCPGFVRVNVRGRERNGCVPAARKREVLDEIKAGLATYVDAEGEPCVSRMLTPEELLGTGKAIDSYPDLIVLWAEKPTLGATAVHSPQLGELRRAGVASGRSGHHGSGAMAIVVAGRSASMPVDGAMRCEDVPATILAACGSSTDHLPGRPLLATKHAPPTAP
jgi:predicted AlkP superfamily phosphohydrolase/phosphomutase